MFEYSDAEKQIINHFGYSDIMDRLDCNNLYRLMIIDAFINRDESKYADALRTAYDMFFNKKIYRLTDEFENALLDVLND